MKKLFLSVFVLTSLLLTTSCGSDDDGGGIGGVANVLVTTIDGQALTFDTIFVQRDTYTDFDGELVTDLYVTALSSADATKIIEIDVRLGALGADVVDYFYYQTGDLEYEDFASDFNSAVTVNDGSRLTMTFSGTLTAFTEEGEVTITISNGALDAIY